MKLSDRADEILQVLAKTDAGTEIYALYDEILAALRLAETIPAIREREPEIHEVHQPSLHSLIIGIIFGATIAVAAMLMNFIYSLYWANK